VTLNVRAVRDDADLQAILALQQDNHVTRVSADEAREQGFVTVAHTLDVLRAMHAMGPSKGVFHALYRGHRERNGKRFDLLVTEVATRNLRSMRAHARVGFEVLHRCRDEIDDWAILGWTW
jgi:hypothetical protein